MLVGMQPQRFSAGVAVGCGKSLVEGGLHRGRGMSLLPPYMSFLAVQHSHPLLSLLCCCICISGCRKTDHLWQGDGRRLLFDHSQPADTKTPALTTACQGFCRWQLACLGQSPGSPSLWTGRSYWWAGSCVSWWVWQGWGPSSSLPKQTLYRQSFLSW